MPLLVYRTGPYAPSGIPLANGFVDYFELINARDGGINGVKVTWEECETSYNNDRGVECYERLKKNGPTGATVFNPYATGITYALIERATADKIPIFSMGYGRADATIGSVFPYVFTAPATYWAGADAIVQYIQAQEKGSLKGKKIALVYHDSAYGKEPISTLQALAKQEGYTLNLFPVAHPGLEQKATWLQIGRQLRPDWVIMWGWGVMNQVAIQEAVNIRFPMDHFIGIWWSGSENDVRPAGAGADGYKALTFHNLGSDYPLYDDLRKYVVEAGKAAGAGDQLGTVLYNRGMYAAMLAAEAIKTAQEIHGTSAITPEQMRDGMENLVMTEEKMVALGLPAFGPEFEVSCENHGGNGYGAVAQWDAEAGEFSLITDYYQSDQDVIMPLVEEDSAAFAAENGIEPGCN
jgi:branched-chain amino acid transport system substrate-binding protein